MDFELNMNVFMNESNNSILVDISSTDNQLNSMHENLYGGTLGKVGYFLMIFLNNIVGTVLLLGIIIFETFGGDPLKKRH